MPQMIDSANNTSDIREFLGRLLIREFLERLRKSLQAQKLAADGELPELLAEFGRRSEAVNARLRECFYLIKGGRYFNAVALAEREPNLLELCALLEIPERDLLASVAQVREAQAPTLVNRDLVTVLQEAYQKKEAANDDLRALHRLTLARAPLPIRLGVMRRVLAHIPNHPFLASDIRAFEKIWFGQAIQFTQPFVKQCRPEVVQEVLEDLRQGGFIEKPPVTLISHLEAQLAKARVAQLSHLAAEIRRAFAERSLGTLTHLAERWRSSVAHGSLLNAEAQFGVSEALNWLNGSNHS